MIGSDIIDHPSPNFDVREGVLGPDMIVIHYTGMQSCAAALHRLCDPAPDGNIGRVSAHFTIDEDGTIYRHVAPEYRAWHAGVSSWAGRSRLNDYAIGIELVNPGHDWGYRPFTDDQIKRLIVLVRSLMNHFSVPKDFIVGHQDIAPTRKRDPGALFPWDWLAWEGLCLWPRDADIAAVSPDQAAVMADEAVQRAALQAIGYTDDLHVPLSALVAAFNARFCAAESDVLSPEAAARLLIVAGMRGWRP